MASRIDSFTGSSAEYVEYLELTIRHLRVHHQTCTIQAHDLGRPPSGTDIRADAACTPQAAPSAAPAYSSHALEPRHSFQFISYQPCGEQPKRRKPNGPWQKFATHLVEKTPKAQNWWFAVKESGIDEAMSTGKIAAFLLDRDCPTPSSSSRAIEVSVSQDGGNDALLTRLTSYARVAMLRETNATMMMVLANFQKFLVLSSCAVLRASGVSIESVHDIVKVCIGDIGEVYCRRTLRVAIFLNELIDKLDARGWGSRASELFLLWNQQPSSFHCLASRPCDSMNLLTEKLCQPQFTEVEARGAWTPLFIPSLIHSILEKRISVVRISRILGYQHAEELSVQPRANPWQFYDLETD